MNNKIVLKFISANNLEIPSEVINAINSESDQAEAMLKDYLRNYFQTHEMKAEENRQYLNLLRNLEDTE